MHNGQQQFLKLIKAKIPAHAVLEQELAKVLKIAGIKKMVYLFSVTQKV